MAGEAFPRAKNVPEGERSTRAVRLSRLFAHSGLIDGLFNILHSIVACVPFCEISAALSA